MSHTTDDLIFEWYPEEEIPLVVEPIQLPQLELIHNATEDCTAAYSTGNFTCLMVVFKFRRMLGYFMFQTYIPTCLIVMMSWISFWIKPEAVPARVTLGVTSLLTLSTQHANSQKALPPVSYIKAIDMFMNACTVFVFCSLIEYALINVIMGDASEIERKNKKEKKRPGSLANLLSKARREFTKQKTNCVRQVEILTETNKTTDFPFQPRSDSMDEFNTLECSHLSPHHHCHFHQYQNLPPPPPLYQTASCPKHGQKQLVDQEAPLEKIKPISQVAAKNKQMDTKEILKILRERAICIVSSFRGLSSCETIIKAVKKVLEIWGGSNSEFF